MTLRSTAAEAGVSLRLVQYYFQDKEHLMQAALRHLERESNDRWAARLASVSTAPRDFVEAFLAEALPSDERSRAFHRVGSSFAALAMTDAGLAGRPLVDQIGGLEDQLVDALSQAQDDGDVSPELDVECEAVTLLSASHGLGTSVLLGHRTEEDATRILRYHLDRMFGPSQDRQGENSRF